MVLCSVVQYSCDPVAIIIAEELLIAKPLSSSIVATELSLFFWEWHFMLFNKLSLSYNVHWCRIIFEIVYDLIRHSQNLRIQIFVYFPEDVIRHVLENWISFQLKHILRKYSPEKEHVNCEKASLSDRIDFLKNFISVIFLIWRNQFVYRELNWFQWLFIVFKFFDGLVVLTHRTYRVWNIVPAQKITRILPLAGWLNIPRSSWYCHDTITHKVFLIRKFMC